VKAEQDAQKEEKHDGVRNPEQAHENVEAED